MEKLTKALAKKLMAIEQECRGIHLRNDAEYILTKKGKAGLELMEKELARLGFPIKYGEVKNMGFYPAGLRPLSLLASQKVFGWDNDGIRKMCGFAAGASFIVKLYMKYFYSIPKVLEKASKMWGEYWTYGKLLVKDYDEKEKRVTISIEDFDLHPIYCRCLEGYFKGLTKMVTKTKNPECKETECSFGGGKGHRFVIKY